MVAHPDVTVICGRPECLDEGRQIVKDPTLLVEVMSSSTEDHDRGKKATFYRFLSSLQEFLLVRQEPVFVEHTWRLPDGTWQIILHQEMEALVELQSIGVSLPVALVYEDLAGY